MSTRTIAKAAAEPAAKLAVQTRRPPQAASIGNQATQWDPGAQMAPPAGPLLFGNLRYGSANRRAQAHWLAGNLRAKLEVGAITDPVEAQADRMADAALLGHAPCACGGTCNSCQGKAKLRRQADSPSAPAAPNASAVFAGAGRALDPATRTFFGRRFGADFSGVRIHDDPETASNATAIRARAFTAGNDIGFSAGEYKPHSEPGRRLLAHELAHVLMDDPVVRRQPQPAGGGQGGQPQPGQTVPRPPGLPVDGGFSLMPVPADQAKLLQNVPEGQLVDAQTAFGFGAAGQAPVYGPPPPPTAGTAGTNPFLPAAENLGGAAGGVLLATGQQLGTFGFSFASAGPNGIGLVMFPQAPLLPWLTTVPSRMKWGHTAMYVRMGGRIVSIRSYGPSSLAEAALTSGVKTGEAGVPASIYSQASAPGEGIPMFSNTSARSIEWPVDAATAEAAAKGMPVLGKVTGGKYTGVPATEGGGEGINCVEWAAQQSEAALGGKYGPVGPGGAPTSIADLGAGGQPGGGPMQASQGRAYRWVGELGESRPGSGIIGFDPETGMRVLTTFGEDGKPIFTALPEAATAAPVVGQMSRGMQVLRWGGRVFFVIGVAATAYEIYSAKPEERERTAVGALAGFAGGFAAGAAAGLVCGPGAPVCSIVLGLTFGFLGGAATRGFAELAYDEKHPHGTPITDPVEIAKMTAILSRPGTECPNCHKPAGGTSMLTGGFGGLSHIDPSWFAGQGDTCGVSPATGQPHTGDLTPDEMKRLLDFVGAQPAPGAAAGRGQ